MTAEPALGFPRVGCGWCGAVRSFVYGPGVEGDQEIHEQLLREGWQTVRHGSNVQYVCPVHVNVPRFTCPTCHRTSWNPNDVANNYCGHCHVFHGRDTGV